MTEPPGFLRYSKHFLCGAIAGFVVQVKPMSRGFCSPRPPAKTPYAAVQRTPRSCDAHHDARSCGCAHHDAHSRCASQIPTFPFDTLKKRLQSVEVSRSSLEEARVLLAEGGPLRFYRGFWVKCLFVSLNGAVFNTVFVAVRRMLRMQD